MDSEVIHAKTDGSVASNTTVEFQPDLTRIRNLSTVLPGALPLAVNGVRVAASIRPRKFVIAGGDETPVTMPRTAFQIVYPDCTVMIDSGLDKTTHDSFSPEKPEPYDAKAFARLQRALSQARLIVLTHHHADHVAGVLRANDFAALAGKTVISRDVADCLVNTPHRPHLKILQETIGSFIVLDYQLYYPVAPGVVLIRSPGHSRDSQMVFIRLQSGREILHSVDSAWIMDNILQVRGKAAPWVKEDVLAVMAQLHWLNGVVGKEKTIAVLVTHDNELFESQQANGTIGELAI
ncbi:MAG: MBL fold metallo-hydrolase [Xanthobacteraceae bacterium]